MKLAQKIWNRLLREGRHVRAYTRAKCFGTHFTTDDLLAGWLGARSDGINGCLAEWIAARPRLIPLHLELPLHEEKVMVCAEAERVLEGEIEVFGKPSSLRSPKLWFQDPLTRKAWPSESHFTRFQVFHPSRDGVTDIRRLWEIGRFGWALPLARAYGLTRRAIYAKAWGDFVRDFIRQNQPEFGPHWLNAMEVAIRSIQWSRALAIFLETDRVDGKTPDVEILALKEVLPSLITHGRYIRNHLEWTPRGRTNHYIADLVGLLALSIFTPQFVESKAWRSQAIEALQNEMKIQTDVDGFHAEASTAYHHFVIELYQLAQHIDREHGLSFGDIFHATLTRMMEIDRMLRGSEEIDPRIGDDDSGKLYVPAVGAVPVKKGQQSAALRGSGLFILRSELLSCHVSCGPNGQQGVGGHAHNDKLSVVIRIRGHPVIVDPGTGCYSADVRLRDRFRSTPMHNTIVVNGQEQNLLRDWRMLHDRTRAHVVIWRDSDQESFFVGEHFGYESQGCIHRRTLQLDKKRGRLTVLDELQGEGEWRFDFYLHFAPDLDSTLVKIEAHRVKLPGAELVFEEKMQLALESSLYSPVYGVKRPSLMLHAGAVASGAWRCPWECRVFP